MTTQILRLEEALYKRDYSNEPVGNYEFPARTESGRKAIPFACRECIWFEEKVPLFFVMVYSDKDIKHVVRASENCTCLVMHGDVFFPSGPLGRSGHKHVILMRDDDQPFALPTMSDNCALVVRIQGTVMRRLDGMLDHEISSGGYFSRHQKPEHSELCTLLVGHTDVCVDFATVEIEKTKNTDLLMKRSFIAHPSPLVVASSSRIKSVLIKLHDERINLLPRILDTPPSFKKLTEPRRYFLASEIFENCGLADVDFCSEIHSDFTTDQEHRENDDEMDLGDDCNVILVSDVTHCISKNVAAPHTETTWLDCSGLYWSQ